MKRLFLALPLLLLLTTSSIAGEMLAAESGPPAAKFGSALPLPAARAVDAKECGCSACACGETTIARASSTQTVAKPTIYVIGAAWCAPCASLGRELQGRAAELEGIATIVKIDGDTDPAYREKYGVREYPTCVVVAANGDEIGRTTKYATDTVSKLKSMAGATPRTTPVASPSYVSDSPTAATGYRAPHGHTHTCNRCGTTWDHDMNPGHNCPRCGTQQLVQDTGRKMIPVAGQSPANYAVSPSAFRTMTGSAGLGGCSTGGCSTGTASGGRSGLFRGLAGSGCSSCGSGR